MVSKAGGSFGPAADAEAPPLQTRVPTALYIHVPFCVHRCPYCDFAVARRSRELESAYLSALRREAEFRLPAGFQARTVFVGGGTPTELSETGFERFVDFLRPLSEGARELSIEANPGTLTERKIRNLLRLGANRISLGAQSLNADTLRALGRRHAPEDVRRAVSQLRAAGLENINLDLIFGAPGQSLRDLAKDLEALLELAPSHVSAYGLTIERGTRFFAEEQAGRLAVPEEDLQIEQMRLIRRELLAAGFQHYEVSNFARPGRACAHNRVYWRNGAYYGLGNSAASHLAAVRIRNSRSVKRYIRRVKACGHAIAAREALSFESKLGESVLLALRTARGIRGADFDRDFGPRARVFERYADLIARYKELGFLEGCPDGVRLSGLGLELADSIATEFLEPACEV